MPFKHGICEARNEASLNNPTPAFVSESVIIRKDKFKYLTDLKLRPLCINSLFQCPRSRDLAKSLPLPNGRRAMLQAIYCFWAIILIKPSPPQATINISST